MNKKTKEVLQIVIFLAIGIVLLKYAVRGENIHTIVQTLKSANYLWVVVSLALALLSNISRAVRWNMLIKPLGYKPRLRNTFAAVNIAYFANLALPRLGEVSRCAIINKYEGAPVSKIFGTVIIERIIDALTLLLILIITVVLQFKILNQFTHTYVIDPLKAKLDVLTHSGTKFYSIVAVAIIALALIVYFGIKMLSKMHFYQKLKHFVQELIEGVRTIEKIEHKGWFLFHSVFIWVMYYLMAYACFFCFSATSNLGLLAGLSVLVFGSIGFAAPVPGGLGAYHTMVTQTLLLYYVPAKDCVAYAFITHESQLLGMIVFGLGSIIALPLMNSKRKEPVTLKPMLHYSRIEKKIVDIAALSKMVHVWRFKDKKIVFTNGCFDILHRGHIHLLAEARDLGDVLIVGLNTDASVSKLKPGRPIQDETTRSLVMASLSLVDAIILFNEDTPIELIKAIQPDVLVKGGDYKPETVVGADVVKANGGSVEIVPLLEGFSTTAIEQKIKK